jgi:hypothetical protein
MLAAVIILVAPACSDRAEQARTPPSASEPRAASSAPGVTTAGTDTVTRAAVADSPSGPLQEPPNACRYADSRPRPRFGEAAYGQPYDSAAMSRGVTLRCALRGGGPEVRLVVQGEWAPTAVDVFDPPAAPRPAQRLLLDNDQRAYEGSDLVEGEDLNRDGWTDLKVQTWSGTGGVFYDVFMYQPARHRFVKDSALSGGGGVVPLKRRETCVGTGSRTGMGDWVSDDFCWRDGRWVHVRQREQKRLGDSSNPRYVLTVREPRGGRLHTVSVDTSDVDAATRDP